MQVRPVAPSAPVPWFSCDTDSCRPESDEARLAANLLNILLLHQLGFDTPSIDMRHVRALNNLIAQKKLNTTRGSYSSPVQIAEDGTEILLNAVRAARL